MKFLYWFLLAAGVLVFSLSSRADTLTLKNGDRLTGSITAADGKQITLKTDYSGEIKVQWSAIQELMTSKPLYVVTPDKKTVNGSVTLQGTDLVVATTTAGEVRVPISGSTVVRSADAEQAYEKSLHPGILQDWKGGINVGFALARGNSDTTNLSTGFTGDRKTMSDEIKLYSSTIYTTNGPTTSGTPGGVTADAILAGATYDRNITMRLFGFGSGDFTHDALQDLTLRQIYSGGLGWHAINSPNTTLDLLAGVNYTRENYSDGVAVASVSRNIPGLTFGENLTHKMGARSVLTESFMFYPDLSDFSQYRFSLDSSFVSKLNNWLGWQTTIADRYVTNPPIAGTKSNDIILSTGLNITFTH